MIIKAALLIYLVAALFVFAWIFRLDTKASSTGTYVTDHWLGTVQECFSGRQCYPVYPPKNSN